MCDLIRFCDREGLRFRAIVENPKQRRARIKSLANHSYDQSKRRRVYRRQPLGRLDDIDARLREVRAADRRQPEALVRRT